LLPTGGGLHLQCFEEVKYSLWLFQPGYKMSIYVKGKFVISACFRGAISGGAAK
jgi:hypothetical protein